MIPSWPKLMGVLNITPNSFSDGGLYSSLENCTKKMAEILSSEVNYLDVGAESTAPFNKPCTEEIEKKRVEDILIPSLLQLSLRDDCSDFFSGGTLSLDTYRPEIFSFVVRQLSPRFPHLKFLWNDVSGIIDEKTLTVLRENPESDYVYCHNLAPTREQTSFHKDFVASGGLTDFLDHLKAYFQRGLDFFKGHGLQERVYFDPCFGFSKTLKHNEYLLKNLPVLIDHFPKEMKWVIGVSKKSFLREAIKERRSSSQDWEAVEFLHTGFLSLWFAQLREHKLVMRVHNPNVFHGALKAHAMMDSLIGSK